MGIDIPDGSAPPEQPKEASTPDGAIGNNKGRTKGMMIVASLALLAVVGLVIGLVPDWGNDDNNDVPVTPPEENLNTAAQASLKYYESTTGPFEVKIPLFSPNITQEYSSIDEVEHDLEQLARFVLNGAITSNVASGSVETVEDGDAQNDFIDAPEAGAPSAEGDLMAGSSATSGLGSANDFGTNNQEANVDRADVAKSNGEFIFAAYGDALVVVRAADGVQVTRFEVPPIELPEGLNQGGSTGVVDSGFAADSSMPMFWGPVKPYIDALLIEGNRLAVVASGYSMEHTVVNASMPQPIYWDYQNTKVHLYDINQGSDMAYVASMTLNGSFRDAFSKDNNSGYVVTQAGINTWSYLLEPIQRWQDRFAGMSDEEYLSAATLVAEEAIEKFVQALSAEIGSADLTRLSLYAENVSSDGLSEMSMFVDGIANAVTHVVAFDMAQQTSLESELTHDVSAAFHPGSWGHVYAHEQMIIVADQGWSWNDEEEYSSQYTYLLGFSLDGPTSTHSVVGSISGHILSPYSIDFIKIEATGASYIRVATTQNFGSWGGPIVIDDGMMMEDTAVATTEVEPSTLNQIIVLKFPALVSSDPNANVLVQVGQVEMGKPKEVSYSCVRSRE
jgi:Beta propeller domain